MEVYPIVGFAGTGFKVVDKVSRGDDIRLLLVAEAEAQCPGVQAEEVEEQRRATEEMEEERRRVAEEEEHKLAEA